MPDAGVVSYALGAGMFLVLTLLLVTAWPGRMQGALLVGASGVSAIWCGALAFEAATGVLSFRLVEVIEIWRDAMWYAFLFGILGYAQRGRQESGSKLRLAARLTVGGCAVAGAWLLFQAWRGGHAAAEGWSDPAVFVHVLVAVGGLALVEQLFRNTRPEHRWALKYLCLGVGGMFAYDLYLYSDALLLKRLNIDLWNARGVINAMVVPLVAVSAARNPQWSIDIFVSRHIVFHSAALLGAGVYLMVMAAAGYYIRLYGGTWGGVAQIAFLFGAGVLLMVLLSSGQLRSRARVFFSKHFFRNKYDYREEWLRFTHTLSTSRQDTQLRENIIRAIAQIVESPGGVLWVRDDSGFFHHAGRWNTQAPEGCAEPADSPLARFLESHGWVIYLDEHARDPGHYGELELPGWLERLRDPWLIVPLLQGDELLGFIVLQRSPTKKHLNWEDSDLLKTVGREAASYLALLKLTEALADARQFEAFNRLSSYVVHDLKNLAAQLSLLVSNARKHVHNPAFAEDAINTVENVTARMNRLLGQLRKGRAGKTTSRRVDLAAVLREVVAARASETPAPTLETGGAAPSVMVDPDRLAAVLEHIVQNAQEATPADGRVCVRLSERDGAALIEVEDTGCGMDAQFVSERLFRPFDTTKGNAGMGIGVYESREFVGAHGGEITVDSTPGVGTTFRVRLPLAPALDADTPAGDPKMEVAR